MRPAVDVSSLMELRLLQQPGKPDAIARIVGHFLDETTQRLATLRRAVDTCDPRLLEQAAHALKGISGTVGANEMLDLAVRLEDCGRTGRTNGAADLVTELEAAVDRARPIFDRVRGAA
jgi:HPt (histidine-containing phosphotransfer) domain-containing protein